MSSRPTPEYGAPDIGATGAQLRPLGAPLTTDRCPAAHMDDPMPCDGPPVVTVLDVHNAGADACEIHGPRLLASLEGGRVFALPEAPDGAALKVFREAGHTRPFPWVVDVPRTRPEQLSAEERRLNERGAYDS